ncbi:helicase, partial [mine drainage metagenome]
MATVSEQIQSANEAISRNIALLADQRSLLSQNVLAQLRNLVEGAAVCLHAGSSDAEFNYPAIQPALAFVRSRAKFNFLGRFHKLIEKSASHYTLDGDASERLMLKYYEYLHRIRSLLQDNCGVAVLANLEAFPVDLDPSLREYHEKIAARIEAVRSSRPGSSTRDKYYIHKTRPFFVGGHIYYEVTFYRAINKVNKFDRIIAFTDIDMTDKYAAMLTLQRDSIEVLGQTMPITIVRAWEVSIRLCEFNNFARLLGITLDVRANSAEYRFLMRVLTMGSGSLLDLVELPDDKYEHVRATGAGRDAIKTQIFPTLNEVRRIVRSAAPGHNVLRYLMLRMHNQILRPVYHLDGCSRLSD